MLNQIIPLGFNGNFIESFSYKYLITKKGLNALKPVYKTFPR